MASAHSPDLSAASNIVGGAPASPSRSRECSKTPESASGCRSPGSPIGEDSCPICLGAFTDKCAAGSCLHNFCLVCLKEWSKQRPVCPLCKQSFSKILYDIKSETDYKEWKVPILYPNDLNDLEFRGFRQFFDTYGRRFFGYRSTFPRLIRRRAPASSLRNNSILGETNRQQRNFDRGSSLFRLSIYSNNLWVLPLSDITGRYRESSPQLYREQPALTHRLVPWVNRELAALISSSRIGVVLSLIMDLIERHPIDSSEFRQAIRPHLGVWTSHFAHEFYNFARSPYDMVGHDNASQYLPSYDRVRESADESGDDDDIIEVEPEPLDLSSRVAREETIGNDGSVFISSDSDSPSLIVQADNDLEPLYTNRSTFPFSNRENRNSSQETHIPNYDRIPLPSELGEPGPSGVSSSNSMSIKRERSSQENCSDSDDCLVVDILKPKKERTPELIQLSSEPDLEDQEKEARNKISSKIHWKKRKLEARNISKNNHRRPRLDRTSFSLHVTGTLNCQRGEDHTYCTESASPCNPSSTRTESEEEDIGKDPDYESKGSLRDRVQHFRWNRVDSDSDSNIGVTVTSSFKDSGLNKQRHQRKSSNKSGSSSLNSHTSMQKSRKDQKHKVKSSSRASSSAIPEATSSYHSSKRKRNSPPRSRKDLNSNHKRARHYSSSSSSSSFSSSDSSSSSSSSSSCSSFSYTSSSSSNKSSKHTKKSTSSKRRPKYGEWKTSSSDYCESSFTSDMDERSSTSRSKSRSKLSKKRSERSRSSQREKYKKGKTLSKNSSRSRDKRSSKKHKK